MSESAPSHISTHEGGITEKVKSSVRKLGGAALSVAVIVGAAQNASHIEEIIHREKHPSLSTTVEISNKQRKRLDAEAVWSAQRLVDADSAYVSDTSVSIQDKKLVIVGDERLKKSAYSDAHPSSRWGQYGNNHTTITFASAPAATDPASVSAFLGSRPRLDHMTVFHDDLVSEYKASVKIEHAKGELPCVTVTTPVDEGWIFGQPYKEFYDNPILAQADTIALGVRVNGADDPWVDNLSEAHDRFGNN